MQQPNGFKNIERDAYWVHLPRIFIAVVIFLIMLYGLGFVVTGGNLTIYKFWAPKMADAQRQVFENTQGYIQGKIDTLAQERLAYESADPGSAQQKALRTMIITEASTVDNTKLPLDMQSFIVGLKGGF